MQAPGIEIRPIKQINGGQSFNQVFFTDVRIPHENVVGKVNDGWRGAITTLMNERASIGSGTGGPGFRDLLRLAKETDWNGRPALEDPAVRQRLADFYVKTKGLQYTGYRTQTALSHGQTPGPEASIGKLVGAPLRQQMASFALELQGLTGTLTDEAIAPEEATWQRSWLGAPGLRLAGGTDEILRNIVAERVLRLPGEPRMDKDLPFQKIPTGPPSR
jgi:alkylation response protein AidB-like acyl-CoA dehydrogenase